jgi:hypothetical protein
MEKNAVTLKASSVSGVSSALLGMNDGASDGEAEGFPLGGSVGNSGVINKWSLDRSFNRRLDGSLNWYLHRYLDRYRSCQTECQQATENNFYGHETSRTGFWLATICSLSLNFPKHFWSQTRFKFFRSLAWSLSQSTFYNHPTDEFQCANPLLVSLKRRFNAEEDSLPNIGIGFSGLCDYANDCSKLCPRVPLSAN